MNAVASFSPQQIAIRTLDGASLYAVWRREELATFEDPDSEQWFVAHVPSGSVLPFCFLRAADAAQFVLDLYPLRNQWTDVDHGDFLRLLPDILRLGAKHHGHRWRTMFDFQPENLCNMNGFGGPQAA